MTRLALRGAWGPDTKPKALPRQTLAMQIQLELQGITLRMEGVATAAPQPLLPPPPPRSRSTGGSGPPPPASPPPRPASTEATLGQATLGDTTAAAATMRRRRADTFQAAWELEFGSPPPAPTPYPKPYTPPPCVEVHIGRVTLTTPDKFTPLASSMRVQLLRSRNLLNPTVKGMPPMGAAAAAAPPPATAPATPFSHAAAPALARPFATGGGGSDGAPHRSTQSLSAFAAAASAASASAAAGPDHGDRRLRGTASAATFDPGHAVAGGARGLLGGGGGSFGGASVASAWGGRGGGGSNSLRRRAQSVAVMGLAEEAAAALTAVEQHVLYLHLHLSVGSVQVRGAWGRAFRAWRVFGRAPESLWESCRRLASGMQVLFSAGAPGHAAPPAAPGLALGLAGDFAAPPPLQPLLPPLTLDASLALNRLAFDCTLPHTQVELRPGGLGDVLLRSSTLAAFSSTLAQVRAWVLGFWGPGWE